MSYTINYLGKTEHIENGKTCLLDLVKNEKKYICARVNNRLRELTYEVFYDAKIEFLTVSDYEAVKIYEASLRFIIAMATHNIYPNVRFRFCYNVSRSIFMQFLDNTTVSLEMVENIEKEIKRIVDADYPLHRLIIPKDLAENIYRMNGLEDKIPMIEYRPEKTVHLYECNTYLNYMFSRMVPSTGYIKSFKLLIYTPGIIIQYPRSECNGEIPKFEDAPTFGKTLKESHTWAKITGADSVSSINKHIEKDGIVDFIQLCESRHNNMLYQIGSMIEKNINDIRIICIAGPSSSGKTTFANRLRIELLSRGFHPIRISLDDYYLTKEQLPLDENGEPDFESIEGLDLKLFNENMIDLINGKEVQLPKFDFTIGKRVPGRTLKIGESEPIIIEGIHALNKITTQSIPRHQKFKIFISPQAQINLDNANPISLTDLRLLRRLVRDYKFRNSSAEETISMWPNVRKGEFKWIYDTQEGADYVFNSMLYYELCVMKKYALPLLSKIEIESEYFPIAERLMRLLKYFDNMPDEWVPCNSLLREFIGGSCYEDA